LITVVGEAKLMATPPLCPLGLGGTPQLHPAPPFPPLPTIDPLLIILTVLVAGKEGTLNAGVLLLVLPITPLALTINVARNGITVKSTGGDAASAAAEALLNRS